MLDAFLYPFAVTVIWAILFGFAVLLTRMGARERNEETKKQVEEEEKATREAGWTPLHP